MWNPFKKSRQRVSVSERKKQSCTAALKKLKTISTIKDKQKLIDEATKLARKFFKSYFDIHYYFTNEELSDELARRKIDAYIKKKINSILERTSETNYNFNHSGEELKALLEDIKEVIKLL